jgi:hypothetical protein
MASLIVSYLAPKLYPVKLAYLSLYDKTGNRVESIFELQDAEWGQLCDFVLATNEVTLVPYYLDIIWLSAVEQVCYKIQMTLDAPRILKLMQENEKYKENGDTSYLTIGLAPYGVIALWLNAFRKSVLIHSATAEQVANFSNEVSIIQETSQKLLMKNTDAQKHLLENGMPPKDLFYKWMQQYDYRYVPLEEYFDGTKWSPYSDEDYYYDNIDLDAIWDMRTDGTYHKIDDDALTYYHKAGCPQRIAVTWHEGTLQFNAFFWIDCTMFSELYESINKFNIEKRAEFLLRLDSRSMRFELALSVIDIPSNPQMLPSEAYQCIIFRNNYEYYKSENYNQEDGAWRW